MHLLKLWPLALAVPVSANKSWWGSRLVSLLLGPMSKDTTKDTFLASVITDATTPDLVVEGHCYLLTLQLRAAHSHASTLTSTAAKICAAAEKERIRFAGDSVEISLNDIPELYNVLRERHQNLVSIGNKTDDLATLFYIRQQLASLRWLQSHLAEDISKILHLTRSREYYQYICAASREHKLREGVTDSRAFQRLKEAKKVLSLDPSNWEAFVQGIHAAIALELDDEFEKESQLARSQGLHL